MTQNLNPIPPEPEPGSALQPLDNAPPPGRPIPGYASEAELRTLVQEVAEPFPGEFFTTTGISCWGKKRLEA